MTAEAMTSLRTCNKVAVYGFPCICVKLSLFLIDKAEHEDDHAKVTALNTVYDLLIDLYSCFEQIGLCPENVQSVLELRTMMRGHDLDFNRVFGKGHAEWPRCKRSQIH